MAESDIYDVEDLLEYKVRKGKECVLIKWAGYSVAESSWEPLSHLVDPAPKLLEKVLELRTQGATAKKRLRSSLPTEDPAEDSSKRTLANRKSIDPKPASSITKPKSKRRKSSSGNDDGLSTELKQRKSKNPTSCSATTPLSGERTKRPSGRAHKPSDLSPATETSPAPRTSSSQRKLKTPSKLKKRLGKASSVSKNFTHNDPSKHNNDSEPADGSRPVDEKDQSGIAETDVYQPQSEQFLENPTDDKYTIYLGQSDSRHISITREVLDPKSYTRGIQQTRSQDEFDGEIRLAEDQVHFTLDVPLELPDKRMQELDEPQEQEERDEPQEQEERDEPQDQEEPDKPQEQEERDEPQDQEEPDKPQEQEERDEPQDQEEPDKPGNDQPARQLPEDQSDGERYPMQQIDSMFESDAGHPPFEAEFESDEEPLRIREPDSEPSSNKEELLEDVVSSDGLGTRRFKRSKLNSSEAGTPSAIYPRRSKSVIPRITPQRSEAIARLVEEDARMVELFSDASADICRDLAAVDSEPNMVTAASGMVTAPAAAGMVTAPAAAGMVNAAMEQTGIVAQSSLGLRDAVDDMDSSAVCRPMAAVIDAAVGKKRSSRSSADYYLAQKNHAKVNVGRKTTTRPKCIGDESCSSAGSVNPGSRSPLYGNENVAPSNVPQDKNRESSADEIKIVCLVRDHNAEIDKENIDPRDMFPVAVVLEVNGTRSKRPIDEIADKYPRALLKFLMGQMKYRVRGVC